MQTVLRRQIFSFLPRPFAPRIIGKQHAERVLLGYSRQKLFDVVIDINSYSEFLPWCTASHVLKQRQDNTLDAELRIGFKPFEERYVSHVAFRPHEYVQVQVREGRLFHHLHTTWSFADVKGNAANDATELSFVVDFSFANALHQKVAEMFFREVASTMVSAFEKRCRQIYGRPSRPMTRLS
jgi:ribosome-associated toxin RatA of RatAB toxin-antitoxin module